MAGTLILWGHALAALLFATAALAVWRRPRAGRRAFAAALVVTALWALAVAGIDPRDLSVRLAESLRNLAWIGFTFALLRRTRAGGWALASVCAVIGLVVVAGAGLAIAEAVLRSATVQEQIATARLLFRMMAAAGALILVRHLHAAAAPERGQERGGVRMIALALGVMWAADLLLSVAAFSSDDWSPVLLAARGFVVAGVALLLLSAAQRRDGWTLSLSRPATVRALAAVALVVYLGLAVWLARFAGSWGGHYARALQAGVVIGAATALLVLLSTSWLGAWAKVKLAKHLFRHRYDYRTEWQRFTDTLGGGDAALEARVVAAVANLLAAPAGVLLVPGGAATGWAWDGAVEPLSDVLAAHLAEGRIVELDAVRARTAPDDAAVVPSALLAEPDAWALVPLIHGEALAGAVLLARPPISRALDWEDFDLLRVAGRQAASYLAEDRAGRALAEARRFDEFNRRFAFILHDIKNLVSQQQLVARNAERHASNPAFRADMVATLKESADRMTALLARLSQREAAAPEPLMPVNAAAVAIRVATARRAQHPVACAATPAAWARAHPQRLEQVLGHLIQNAAEASAPGVPVEVAVTALPEQVVITVADRGVGMDATFVRDDLFRPFASTKPGGFGIGAYEARQLVTAMAGTLAVESRAGAGTRFTIVLPAAQPLEVAA